MGLVPGCPFVAKGETMDAAMTTMKEHGMSAHPTEMDDAMAKGMTEEMMMNKMKEVAKME